MVLDFLRPVCTPEALSVITKYMQEDQGMRGRVEQRDTTLVINGSLTLATSVLKEGVTGKNGWGRSIAVQVGCQCVHPKGLPHAHGPLYIPCTGTDPRNNPARSSDAVGLARYTYSNCTTPCIEYPSAAEQTAPPPSPAPAPASDAGRGSVSWVWIVLGTLLGLGAGCVAMLGLFMFRRWRQKSMAVAGADRGEARSGKGPLSGSTDRQASGESGQSLEQDLEEGLCSGTGSGSLEATLRSTRYALGRHALHAALTAAILAGIPSVSRASVVPARFN